MFRNINIRRFFLVVMAFAVFYVFLGSLINFHANRIIGAELLAQAYPSIKPKTKESTIQFLDTLKAKTGFDFSITMMVVLALASILIPFTFIRRQELQFALPPIFDSGPTGLRAPPIK